MITLSNTNLTLIIRLLLLWEVVETKRLNVLQKHGIGMKMLRLQELQGCIVTSNPSIALWLIVDIEILIIAAFNNPFLKQTQTCCTSGLATVPSFRVAFLAYSRHGCDGLLKICAHVTAAVPQLPNLCHAEVLGSQKPKRALRNLRISAAGNHKWFFNDED